MPFKDAIIICKTIMRNGYDAYIINANLQQELYNAAGERKIDIACEPGFEELEKLFPGLENPHDPEILALLHTEGDTTVYFYSTDVTESSHPEVVQVRLTGRIIEAIKQANTSQYVAVVRAAGFADAEDILEDLSCGCIKFKGIPQLVLRRQFIWAIRALRIAANYDLPIDPNTWVSIIQAAGRIVDYVPPAKIMDEWRLVSAENMWRFIELLQQSTILDRLIPEIAALAAMKQHKGKNSMEEESILAHSIACMRYYPEENLHHDWVGTVAVLFHEIGKLYTADSFDGRWTFFQYHRVGAKVARKILRRLHFDRDEIDTICNIIRNHVRFQSMLTDRGLHRFLALPDTERIIELTRANIKAQPDENYTNFNHNLKYMERADKPLSMLEPLLNGNQIMEHTQLQPGPEIGIIRDALLKAQILGKITNTEDAIVFVKGYKI